MGFQIQPLQEFLVRPNLPPSLPRMMELASNVVWSWEHAVRAVFRRLDSHLWDESGHNPSEMLSKLSAAQLERVGSDPRFISVYRRACERFDAYIDRYNATPKQGLIAYFCMEYGVVQCLPIYSGGLGILAGDHLKAASDLGLPLVAVGLLYQKGYFRQYLNPDGWQQERPHVNDFYIVPVQPVSGPDGKDLMVTIDLPTGTVYLKVWQMNTGGVRLFLLDSNVPENRLADHRSITDHLYGGDDRVRIRQEIALGIGGLRALKALGIQPTVFHMNEGHSAFLAIERIRVLMEEQGLSFREALEATRQNNVFTTHTSVPAGFDLFEPSMVYEYFHGYCERAGIPFDELLALGRRRRHDHGERFNMAVCALHTAAHRNAVSALHSEVSRELFQDLWPESPESEVPVQGITNGVHLPSWVNGDLASLYDQYLQPDWMERHTDPEVWDGIAEIPDAELWEIHRRRKRRLVQFVRESLRRSAAKRKASAAEIQRLSGALDFDALTIGFGRRFATYKRATLIFRDKERLKRILNHPDMPVQIIIAGKAHPKDQPGKNLIREIWSLTRDPELSRRVVFVEDYSIQVGREIIQGVDVWLNNPRRPEEACGTSGMKAGINGVLNLSILDGWFDEAYEESGGWAIGDRENYSDGQDDMHASNIYSLLENEVVPMFYNQRERGVPAEWMPRMRMSLAKLSPRFNSGRMLRDYNEKLYLKADEAWTRVSGNNFAGARQHSQWMDRVLQAWDRIRFVEVSTPNGKVALSGETLPIEAVIDLGGLAPDDIRVEAVVGNIGPDGCLINPSVVPLQASGGNGAMHVFRQSYQPVQTGRLGYSLRVTPNHSDNPLMRPCHSLMKWAQQ